MVAYEFKNTPLLSIVRPAYSFNRDLIKYDYRAGDVQTGLMGHGPGIRKLNVAFQLAFPKLEL